MIDYVFMIDLGSWVISPPPPSAITYWIIQNKNKVNSKCTKESVYYATYSCC